VSGTLRLAGSQPTAERPVTAASRATQPLAGRVIAVDPGHNGANWSHQRVAAALAAGFTAFLNRHS
jgi:hypothetical protein